MKTIVKIVLLLLLTTGVMPMAAREEVNNREPLSSFNFLIPDTLISNQYLKVDSFRLGIVPPSTGVQFYEDGIIYLSSTKADSRMFQEHLSFGKTNASYAILNDSLLENPRIFSPSMNFTYPCEAVTFSNDYKTMYLTRYSVSDGVEKIYQAKYSPGSSNQNDWSVEATPMSFCSGPYSYTHPALSSDGNLMIFASNRPGSLGGMDLFITQNDDGKWSEPENLGDAINSRFNELHPFLDQANNLFFSSDGLLGFGGYDIYVCKFRGNTWDLPKNLSGPVNTRFDDVAFTISRKDGKSAFYTVRQKSGNRPLQLLKVTMKDGGASTITNLSQFFTHPVTPGIIFLVKEPAVEATDRRTEAGRQRLFESRSKEDNIVYRVQFMTSFNPGTRSGITVDGKDLAIYEYLYSGAYRLCVGEFSSISPAIELRNTLIRNDYPQATVVVFNNNVRSFDPELLDEQLLTAPPLAASDKPAIPAVEDKKVVTITAEAKKELPAPETKKAEPVKTVVPEPEAKKAAPVKTTAPEEAPAKTAAKPAATQKSVVAYRVQILSNSTSKGSYKLTVNNKVYDTFEYKYAGAFRTCVGEFATLAPAKELQSLCRKAGHSQAFVVAFKDNVRSTDPELFK